MTTTGFAEYSLTRTSDVYRTEDGILTMHSCDGLTKSTQDVKYQVAAQFYLNHVELGEFYDDHDETKGGLNPALTVVELKEYAIRFNCCDKNSIRLVGMKYLLNSKAAIQARRETFRNLQFVPWVNNAGHIYGT